MDGAIAIAKKAINDGKAVVIGLQSTGEAGAESEVKELAKKGAAQGDLEFISAPAVTLRNLVFKLFPMPPKPKAVLLAEEAAWEEAERQEFLAEKARMDAKKAKKRDQEASGMTPANYVLAHAKKLQQQGKSLFLLLLLLLLLFLLHLLCNPLPSLLTPLFLARPPPSATHQASHSWMGSIWTVTMTSPIPSTSPAGAEACAPTKTQSL